MAKKNKSKKKPAGHQDDLLGLAPVVTLKQAQPSPDNVLGSPVPTIKLQDNNPSQTTTATGSTDSLESEIISLTEPTNCARNGFKLELFYRDVEELDERTDRRG